MTLLSEHTILSLEDTVAHLPPECPSGAQDTIDRILKSPSFNSRLVVLDDDPTGTQTCHDIAVLTAWDIDTLLNEFRHPQGPGYFILTNSRALPPPEAEALVLEICQNVATAAKQTATEVEIVLRGDSTLRGHFPLEADVAESVFGRADAWILAPFFFQGGRYTIRDVHYVEEKPGKLVPAGHTQFARDATFGYTSSNLKDYVHEKAPGRFTGDQLYSISIHDIRVGGPQKVCDKLLALPPKQGGVVIVNAAAEEDMHVFVAGLLMAKSKGKRFLYRTAAAFVSSRLGIRAKPPVAASDLGLSSSRGAGGLIVVGSYVPKTTAQLRVLTERQARRGPGVGDLAIIEMSVEKLMASPEGGEAFIEKTARQVDSFLLAGKDTLVMTSRTLIKGHDELSSLRIGSVVAHALVSVLRRVEARPRYIIAKGGITSSDAATKGLNIKRAAILGQAAPGVPVWQCDESGSRHRGVPFVVFPGNVGGEDTLADLIDAWH